MTRGRAVREASTDGEADVEFLMQPMAVVDPSACGAHEVACYRATMAAAHIRSLQNEMRAASNRASSRGAASHHCLRKNTLINCLRSSSVTLCEEPHTEFTRICRLFFHANARGVSIDIAGQCLPANRSPRTAAVGAARAGATKRQLAKWDSDMSSFYDKFASRHGDDARYALEVQVATNNDRSTLGTWTLASVVALPLLMAGWPDNAFAQACCGAEGAEAGDVDAGNNDAGGRSGGDAGGGIGGPSATVAGAVTSGVAAVNDIMGGDGGERVIIIDVRPRADFLKGHLKNAKNVEVRYSQVLRDHVFDESLLGTDKSARIVVYGARANDPAAAAVVRKAQAEGFSNVIWMRGGFAEWVAARLPTTQG